MAKYLVLTNFNGKKENKLFVAGKEYEFSEARAKEILAFSDSLIKKVEVKEEKSKATRKTRTKKVDTETAKDGE